jgi:protein ImuB
MPEQFCAERELCEEQSDRELILHACHEVLEKLERFLLTRQLAVQRVRFRFFHLREPATSLTLGCVQADRTAKHWFSLLSIRFDRLQLPAPVIAIHLCAGKKQSFTVTTSELRFDKTAKQHEGSPMTHLVERLCARIGQELVHGVVTVAEHRPQYAWQPQEPLQQVPHCPAVTNGWYDERLRRPLWMLSEPRPLAVEHNQPYYQGTLRLLDGPERLETGWWDEAGIARDYFVAVNPKGIRLWVYQDRNKESAWYLHGIFG